MTILGFGPYRETFGQPSQPPYVIGGPDPFAPEPAPAAPPPSTTNSPPLPAAAPPIAPSQFAALLYGKAIPVGLASRATWGGRIIEGPVFTVIDNEMTASWIAAFFLPMNYWSNTRTVSELLFDSKLAWSQAGGALLSGLNVGGPTAGTEQRVRFNTGLLSQMPDAWSVARFGADAVAYVPLVTATLQNIRLQQFGADNPIPFVSLTVDDNQFAAPGDLVPWQDALETLARYDGRSSAEFATVDVTDGLEVPFILGADLTLPALLAGLRKIKPQWSVLTKDKLYVVEKGASTLDLTLERAKVLKRNDDPITLHQADALARPREEDYTFIDLDRDFEPSMVRCVEDLEPVISTGSVDIQTIDLPFATTANVVQAMANYAYYSREVARESSEWSGRGDYLGIEPGDTYLISPDELPVAAQHYHRVNEIVRKVDLTVDVKGEAFLTCAVAIAGGGGGAAIWTDVTAHTSDGAGGKSLAISGDGLAIVRANPSSSVNVSHDGGATFTNAFMTEECWVATSTNGSVVVLGITSTVAIPANAVQISTNGGTTWTAHAISGIHYARSVSVSGDGSKIIVGGIYTPMGDGKVYISADGGTTWTGRVPYAYLDGADWIDGVKISRDGSTIYANTSRGGNVLAKSVDGGATWINVAPVHQTDLTVNAPEPGNNYNVMGFACSANGQILMAYEDYEVKIWVSTNGGVSWVDRTPPDVDWGLSGGGLCMSDDGLIFYTISSDYIYRSTDRGVSWIKQNQANLPDAISLRSVACSADGKHVVASDGDTLWIGDFT